MQPDENERFWRSMLNVIANTYDPHTKYLVHKDSLRPK